MMDYRLENYQDQWIHQVIHMDQAVCYCPEYRASKMLHDYPSRRLQLAWAVYRGELPLSDRIGEISFSSILSRQGERWQNFRECEEDCTDVTILVREMLLEKGYQAPCVKALHEALAAGHGRLYPEAAAWDLPLDTASDTAVLLDEETASFAADCAGAFKGLFDRKQMAFANKAEVYYLGFEYFACGLVAEGKAHLKALIESCQAMGVSKVLVLSAKAAYLLRTFAPKLGLQVDFEVLYLPELMDPIPVRQKTYVYAGSFNLRYLRNEALLNGLIPAASGEKVPESTEFTPLLQGDGRVNCLTIWQKPVGAEYETFGADGALAEAIACDAFSDMEKAGAGQIIVFEPTALTKIRERFPEKQVFYYTEV